MAQCQFDVIPMNSEPILLSELSTAVFGNIDGGGFRRTLKQHKIISDQTTLDVDDSFELIAAGNPIPVYLDLCDRDHYAFSPDDIEAEADMVEEYGRNLSSDEKTLISETWAKVDGHFYRVGRGYCAGSEILLQQTLVATLARLAEGYVLVEDPFLTDLPIGLYTYEEFLAAEMTLRRSEPREGPYRP